MGEEEGDQPQAHVVADITEQDQAYSWPVIRFDVPPNRTYHFCHQFRNTPNPNNFLKSLKWCFLLLLLLLLLLISAFSLIFIGICSSSSVFGSGLLMVRVFLLAPMTILFVSLCCNFFFFFSVVNLILDKERLFELHYQFTFLFLILSVSFFLVLYLFSSILLSYTERTRYFCVKCNLIFFITDHRTMAVSNLVIVRVL